MRKQLQVAYTLGGGNDNIFSIKKMQIQATLNSISPQIEQLSPWKPNTTKCLGRREAGGGGRKTSSPTIGSKANLSSHYDQDESFLKT